ncbi:cysteine hydrolase [Streptomyces malaysiensis subsp. malaysiensis]|uniref:Cysteine hydrolase n=1 Tax=Streptomyces malaysiensis TaxID=92644 RepID=A0ABX6W608_STRMQ|nr:MULTISPECIES: cysteine hydrolase [Streptomyces]MCD9590555.1 cysteine hydrolase [Streptomyces sp. 8ZJF_21]QPI55151.1 cysteine hydrolase [Streptomyces solisilvae]UHH16584.1 cysteine hydrolase [Streptomyces sp. HNM0561]WHX22208.1 cysteine hydrolase [Streptomyces sp. NA07423]
MSRSSIDVGRTAVLVIDMQNDFVAEGAPLEFPEGRRVLPAIRKTLDAARARDMAVVYTAHVHRPGGADMGIHRDLYPPVAAGKALVDGERGAQICPELAPRPGEPVIKKHRYNSFYATDLEIVLRGLGVETVVLTGMTTECCVLGTARGALERGFRSLVISDACASCDYPDLGFGAMSADEMHRAALRVMALTSSELLGVDEFLSRLP